MQTFKIDVNDNIVDKILWLLNNFDGVKVEKFDENFNINVLKNSDSSEKEEILSGLKEAVEEVKKDIKGEIELKDAFDFLKEIEDENKAIN